MKNMKKLLALLLAICSVVCLLAACGGGESTDKPQGEQPAVTPGGNENPDATTPGGNENPGTADGPKYGGHLNARSAGRPTGLDPLKQTGAWKYQWTTAVFEPFLSRDAENNIVPGVCDFVMETYNDEDGTLHHELWVWPREGYIFSHDYGQVDMDDIEASFARGLNQYANIKKYVKPNIVVSERIPATDAVKAKDASVEEVFHIDFKYHEKNLYYFATYRTWWPVMPKEICEKYATSYIIAEKEDAVGTGPYIFSDFQDSIQVTLEKRKDYTPVDNSMYTGFATTKYGYMDSMTFWYNSTDASAALAVLSGDYDCTEVIPVDYSAMAADAGIVLTTLPSDQRTWIYFNTMGTNNLCAKYPSLRKAIMAAIDYPKFLDVICDSSQILEGDNIMLDPLYDTTHLWKEADYYGEFDQAVVDKYIAMAESEGYAGEPIQLVYHNGRTDIPTLLCDALENAGINYQLTTMETTTYNAFVGDPSNNWDCYYAWGVTASTPGLLQDSIVENNYKSERKDQIREEMYKLDPRSDEYVALWEEWSKLWVEECQMGYLSAIDWWWWHPATLHINDDAENGNTGRFMFNAYWDDPENHPKK